MHTSNPTACSGCRPIPRLLCCCHRRRHFPPGGHLRQQGAVHQRVQVGLVGRVGAVAAAVGQHCRCTSGEALGCHMAEQQQSSKRAAAGANVPAKYVASEKHQVHSPHLPTAPPSLSSPRSMLADRLLSKGDYDCDRELRTLELLKVGGRRGMGLDQPRHAIGLKQRLHGWGLECLHGPAMHCMCMRCWWLNSPSSCPLCRFGLARATYTTRRSCSR